MSIEALNWALNAPVGGTAKVILIGLANHAGANFTDARPSVPTLATYAHCSRRTVQRYLRVLEEDGWIERDGVHALAGRADRSVTVWRLTGLQTGRQDDTSSVHGVTPGAHGVTLGVARGDTAVSPEPPLNHPEPLSPTDSVESPAPSVVIDLFLYWQRQTGHPNAKPTHDRLAKVRARLNENYTPDQIRAAIDGAAAQPFVNDDGKVFDDLELICRTGSKLEGFIERATYTPQRPQSQRSEHERLQDERKAAGLRLLNQMTDEGQAA